MRNTSCVEYSPLVHQICEVIHCLHSFCCSEFFRHTYAQLRSFYLSTLDAAHMRKTIRFSLSAQLQCSHFGVGGTWEGGKMYRLYVFALYQPHSQPPTQFMSLAVHGVDRPPQDIPLPCQSHYVKFMYMYCEATCVYWCTYAKYLMTKVCCCSRCC